ncbi:MAG: energy transducer TonB [Candidatus Kapabacteria bacterium]|nr:energy transducer TonB [Candidatus Kapabacteria bacterium]
MSIRGLIVVAAIVLLQLNVTRAEQLCVIVRSETTTAVHLLDPAEPMPKVERTPYSTNITFMARATAPFEFVADTAGLSAVDRWLVSCTRFHGAERTPTRPKVTTLTVNYTVMALREAVKAEPRDVIYSDRFLPVATPSTSRELRLDVERARQADGFTEPVEQVDTAVVFDPSVLKKSIVYPEAARRMGLKGTVEVDVVIGSNGHIRLLSVGTRVHPLLDSEALRAVARTRYRAAREGDKRIASWVRIPVVFDLR